MSASAHTPSAGRDAAQPDETSLGFAYAFASYFIWGFLPFFLKAVAHIPASEVVAHRIVWSLPIAGATVLATGRTADLRQALRSPRRLGMAAVTAAFLTVNWSLYVWAIGSGRAVEGALGYYINPLFSVLLAATLLGERLTAAQTAAIGLAVAAVALLGWETGGLPWISLGLAASWGFYALFKKTLPVGPNQGFFLEVLLLFPVALGFIVWLVSTGQSHFGPTGWGDVTLLMLSGPATAVPLILYANGAKRLKLSTIAIMQYIAPTMVFLIAVLVFEEPFSQTRAVAFGLIWVALVIYAVSQLRAKPAAAG
jgi:chloramphenicol-sensitive protein RarD